MRSSDVCRLVIAHLALATGLVGFAQQPKFSPALPLTQAEHAPNSAAAQKAHYLVLVSLDGFRWDYAKRDGATHLLALGKRGVSAPEGMLPSFPSLTFPNQFTIVTGLYPEHHGLVADSFYDPERKANFSGSDPENAADGRWYSGVPLWTLAERQGMRTACIFWPGSEAEIAGNRPTWYAHFDGKKSGSEAVQQASIEDVLQLLHLPETDRPHLIALRFAEPERQASQFGPDAAETRAAIRKMDAKIAKLKAALESTGLPINLVVVSDHGTAKIEGDWIDLANSADLTGFKTAGYLLYGETEAERARVYEQLKHVSSQFKVYRRKDVPAGLNYSKNPREGDPVVIATGPYALRAKESSTERPNAGGAGFDPRQVPEMKGIFFAEGPDIAAGKTVAPFENVNLYPWMAHILGLNPPKTDGSLNILAGTLRDNGGDIPESPTQKD